MVITLFLAITEIPIVITGIEEKIKNDKRDLPKEKWYDASAFDAWFVTLVFNIFFVLMLMWNYPELGIQGTIGINLVTIGINLAWTFSCCRNYLKVSLRIKSRPARWSEIR